MRRIGPLSWRDQDQAADHFHAMVGIGPQVIDGKTLTNQYNQQKRHNWRYLLPKCCQICPAGQWADRVGQPYFFQCIPV